MKPSGSSIVVGVSLALLLPTAAIAQEPAADSLVLEDGTGDFHVLSRQLVSVETVEPTDGPAYADLTGVTVSVDGVRLTVRFDAAEAVPEVPDPSELPERAGSLPRLSISYVLLIDADGDADPEYEIYSHYGEEGWGSEVVGVLDDRSVPGEAVVVDGSVTAKVGLDVLPTSPSEMRFAAVAQVFDWHDPGEIVDVTISGDRVPDDEDDWRALGESDPVAASG